MSNAHDKIVQAFARQVVDPTGWLSDAQSAQLYYDGTGSIRFCGEGSIDLNHLASIAIVTMSETQRPMTTDRYLEAMRERDDAEEAEGIFE